MQKFNFIDLFCGLGGFRLALEQLNGSCVFSSEINLHACEIYKENFGDNPFCDITQLLPTQIPDFDVLCAGFPCQAFSIAGRKKGFEDTRGTLFFDLCRIIKEKQPKFLLLENVKHLTKHNHGDTFKTILDTLTSLNYDLSYKILNAKDFGVAQSRERIIIVGVRKNLNKQKFIFEEPNFSRINLLNILGEDNVVIIPNEYTLLDSNLIKEQKSGLIFCGYRNKNIRKVGVKDNSLHLSRTHKQPNRIYHAKGVHPTLSSQETSGRYFIYTGKNVIKLTLNNCFTLMGFPSTYKKIGSQSNLYNRIGNSVCIPMIKHTMQSILNQYLIQ